MCSHEWWLCVRVCVNVCVCLCKCVPWPQCALEGSHSEGLRRSRALTGFPVACCRHMLNTLKASRLTSRTQWTLGPPCKRQLTPSCRTRLNPHRKATRIPTLQQPASRAPAPKPSYSPPRRDSPKAGVHGNQQRCFMARTAGGNGWRPSLPRSGRVWTFSMLGVRRTRCCSRLSKARRSST